MGYQVQTDTPTNKENPKDIIKRKRDEWNFKGRRFEDEVKRCVRQFFITLKIKIDQIDLEKRIDTDVNTIYAIHIDKVLHEDIEVHTRYDRKEFILCVMSLLRDKLEIEYGCRFNLIKRRNFEGRYDYTDISMSPFREPHTINQIKSRCNIL